MIIKKDTVRLLMEFTTQSDGNMSFNHANHKVVVENRLRVVQQNGFSAFKRRRSKIIPHGFAPKMEWGARFLVLYDGNRQTYDRSGILTPPTVACDAIITNCLDFPIIAPSADCPPVVIFDPNTKIFAVVHGARQSLLSYLVRDVAQKMKEFGCHPRRMDAYIFPGICPPCYTHPKLTVDVPPDLKHCVFEDQERQVLFDLRLMILTQLKMAGVRRTNFIPNRFECTCHTEIKPGQKKYFSAFGHGQGIPGHEQKGNNALFVEMQLAL